LAGGRIVLKEHFRSMPEIIGFSNARFYGGDLQPLRQFGADRLPPLCPVYVPDAVVRSEGQDLVNDEEAQALVRKVARCCANPVYRGRTMSGTAQAKLIYELLVGELGVGEMERRGLRVGNAEAFQGDERDVIFVSLVAAAEGVTGTRRIGTLSKETDARRINVAASRARDQVRGFHSVRPGVLHVADVRRRWLEHLYAPPVHDAADHGGDLAGLRDDGTASGFEQRVRLALRERGYRVRSRFPAGRHRIGLVVEGATRRLALECDGDAGPERPESPEQTRGDAGMSRQRELERVGWTFWRVRGSCFFRNPEAALAELWQTLDRLGIERLEAGDDAVVDDAA
jgi:very-short-patch-repair endonuclease